MIVWCPCIGWQSLQRLTLAIITAVVSRASSGLFLGVFFGLVVGRLFYDSRRVSLLLASSSTVRSKFNLRICAPKNTKRNCFGSWQRACDDPLRRSCQGI
jgi:hypothetical protein